MCIRDRMALAHNGNLSNAYELRSELELGGAIFHTTSDTEIIAYIAVSYTHLDVYKRQGLHLADQIHALLIRQWAELVQKAFRRFFRCRVRRIAPVSYTHLDVYKRQHKYSSNMKKALLSSRFSKI